MASTLAIREYVVNIPDNDVMSSSQEGDVGQDSHTLTQNVEPEESKAIITGMVQDNQSLGPVEKSEVIRMVKGETLMSILTSRGVTREAAHNAVVEFSKVFNPKALKIGQEINIKYNQNAERQESELIGIDFKAPTGNEFILTNENGQFKAQKLEIQLTKSERRVQGQINSSFYAAALKRGVPADIIKEAISALSYDVNWQHDPQSGDKFEIVFDVYEDPTGKIIKQGGLKYASFAPHGQQARKIYHYVNSKGNAGFFTAKGESVVKTLLQTPLDPTKMRVTSRFGLRHHPVLGYSKQHKGVDFGAPVGARVMAAGEGVVVKAGWNGAYGNYVLIRHNSDYSTAYAHLSKISVKAGMRVKQHQEIGKVGMTGRSTGPHLHYEVIYRGHHVNPQSIKQLPATKLDAKEMARFQTVRAQIDEKVASGVVSELVAQSLPIRTG
jgi:murein DD-endopeptidase MepM/ murein hydrolase activator NlpD